ncbi:inhibitor of apoptosis-promoting Bax1-domain-containing protein [Chytriomyces cf. hyalinus JEL632]|nr:inhibitor of apoptosis-promoting Bax1-domain-containing protein [Chytriomyces cf. hyalinus JEL632]
MSFTAPRLFGSRMMGLRFSFNRNLHSTVAPSARRWAASSMGSSTSSTGRWTAALPSSESTWYSPGTSSQRWSWARITGTAGVVGIGALMLETLLNTENNNSAVDMDTLASNMYVREYVNETFRYVGAALVATASSAYMFSRNLALQRAMAQSPIAFSIGGLVVTVGAMFATLYTDPANTTQKHLLFASFAVAKGAMLSSLFLLNPAILIRAGVYSAAIVGSLSWVAATSKSDRFLYLGGPLFGGLCIVAVSSLGAAFLPATSVAMPWLYSISLYGGLALFGGFVLYDTQKVIKHGQLASKGVVKRDAVNESVSLYLDFINIFVRLVQILAMGGNKKR